MRVPKCHWLLIILIFVNLCLMWFFTHFQKDDQINVGESKFDVTIVIPAFEDFENDILSTVNHILSFYPDIQILVLSEKIPYPRLNLPDSNVKVVVMEHNLQLPGYASDPFHYINTHYVLVLPDATRINNPSSLGDLLWKLKEKRDGSILIASVLTPIISCHRIDVDLKRWSLVYSVAKRVSSGCHSFSNNVAMLFHKTIVADFTNVFDQPFYASFFIQARIQNIEFLVLNDSYFHIGKILFTDSHDKWKHEEKLKRKSTDFYKRYGIKRVVSSGGVESWYGCSKNTVRCFPSVADVPYYLYENRWTPPCCLNALRKTAKHVFLALGNMGLDYWLEGGSLLGAARYADIIPWDYDVDIGIFMKNISRSKFLSDVWKGNKKQDEDNFIWEKASEGDFIRVHYSQVNRLHVDIFPFYEKNGVMTKDTWFKTHRQDMEFPARYLKPLKRIPFVGIMALVPNNHIEFLEMKFGVGVIDHPQYPFPEKLLQKPLF